MIKLIKFFEQAMGVLINTIDSPLFIGPQVKNNIPFYLHVGLPKTATTALQNGLFLEHPEIFYLGKSQSFNTEHNCRSKEIEELLAPLLWYQGRHRGLGKVQRKLADQLQRIKGRRLAGSWEGIGIRRQFLFKQTIRNLERVFGAPRIIVTLRNPLDRIPSEYVQALKAAAYNGHHVSFPSRSVFLDFERWLMRRHNLDGHDYRFDWIDNLRFAVNRLGKHNIGVFLHEELNADAPGFYKKIADFMEIDFGIASSLPNKRLNEALTPNQMHLLSHIQANSTRVRQWRKMEPAERKQRFNEARGSSYEASYKPSLSNAQKNYIAKRSGLTYRWLNETFDLDLARFDYPL